MLNVGMPGYTMGENLQLINLRILKYKPEAILYMGFRNDAGWAHSLEDDVDLNLYPRNLAMLPPTVINDLLLSSSCAEWMVRWVPGGLDSDGRTAAAKRHSLLMTPRGEMLFRGQIFLIGQLCARESVQLLWVDQPINYLPSKPLLVEDRRILHDELSKNHIPLLEADDRDKFKTLPMLDDVHFTDAGNRHLAQILAPQVLRELASGEN